MNRRNQNTELPQPGDQPDLPTVPHDPIEPDPDDSIPLPLDEPMPSPISEPDTQMPIGDPKPKEPTRLVA